MDIFDTNEPKKENKEPEIKNELDDIILNKKENSFNIKKLALFGGTAILLLLIVISIVKIVSEKPKTENEDFFASQTPESKAVEEKSFEQVPIIKEETKEPEEKFEQLVQEVIKEEKAKPKEEKPTEKEEIKVAKKEIPKVKETPKKETKKSAPVIKGDYYIQVGAFYRLAPDKKFLNRIKSNGFDYVIKTVIKDSTEIKKVLIGPFASKDEAKKALIKIKQNIKKDAFITRIR